MGILKNKKMSIDVNQLKIGNWLKIKNACNVKVEGVHESGINPDVVMGQLVFDFLYEDLEPIPLDSSVLVKCGFKKVLNNWFIFSYCTDCREAVEIMEIHINISSFRCALIDASDEEVRTSPVYTKGTIQYLHQLQNLVAAIIGEELQITL